jgi:hypothetical protein
MAKIIDEEIASANYYLASFTITAKKGRIVGNSRK